MVVQKTGFEFIYHRVRYLEGFARLFDNPKPSGFMGHLSLLGCLLAMAVPLLASRRSKWAWVGAFGLFVPLYLVKTSLCLVMGLAGLLWVLYFRIPRKIWIISIVVVTLSGGMYMKHVDRPGIERLVVWKSIMKDVAKHPITGWGLDSFSNITPMKDFRYSNVIARINSTEDEFGHEYKDVTFIQWWGNPHNLYISLIYEWGAVGLFLLGGYMRQNILRFKNASKDSNTIALAGFMLVFLGVSIGHFPLWIGRFVPVIVGSFALFEVSTA